MYIKFDIHLYQLIQTPAATENNGIKIMKNILVINEVDCYLGNAWKTKYASHSAVQHQILVNDKALGRRNSVSDDDRGERIVVKKEVPQEFVEFFKQADDLCWKMKSEHCKSIEEYNSAAEFNKPIREKLNLIISEMHAIESLNLSFEDFKRILVWA